VGHAARIEDNETQWKFET